MGFNVEHILHMVGGVGENSYSTNSRLQEKVIHRTRAVVQGAIGEVYTTMLPSRMVMADLGCSSSPNALLVLTKAIHAIAHHCRKLQREPPEIQFILNDLPGNDFNNIFRNLDEYERELAAKMEEEDMGPPPVHYIAAVPGSFYGRLFPRSSVHFFHSSFCLMWRSEVPQEVENGIDDPSLTNKGNIYLWQTSPPRVVEAYQRQYEADFTAFLRARRTELVAGDRMVLTFLGRTKHYPAHGEVSQLLRLLSEAMTDMVSEGILPEEKLDSLNLPLYTPSMEEVEELILQQGKSFFCLERSEIIELNWDPFDDDEFAVFDNARSGKNAASCVRAVMEPWFRHHFGIEEDHKDSMLDDMFSRYAENIARHLLTEKAKYPVFVLVLKAIS